MLYLASYLADFNGSIGKFRLWGFIKCTSTTCFRVKWNGFDKEKIKNYKKIVKTQKK